MRCEETGLCLDKGDAAIDLRERQFAFESRQGNYIVRTAEHAQEPAFFGAQAGLMLIASANFLFKLT